MSRESTKKGCHSGKCADKTTDCSSKSATNRMSRRNTAKACSSKTQDCSTRNSASKSKSSTAKACSTRNSASTTTRNCK